MIQFSVFHIKRRNENTVSDSMIRVLPEFSPSLVANVLDTEISNSNVHNLCTGLTCWNIGHGWRCRTGTIHVLAEKLTQYVFYGYKNNLQSDEQTRKLFLGNKNPRWFKNERLPRLFYRAAEPSHMDHVTWSNRVIQ